MPVSKADMLAAVSGIAPHINTILTYANEIEESNRSLGEDLATTRSQLTVATNEITRLKSLLPATPVTPSVPAILTFPGMITDYKLPGKTMAETARYHLGWMTNVNSRTVRIWHSVEPLTGKAKWNKESIELAAEYLKQSPWVQVILCLSPYQNHMPFGTMLLNDTFNDVLAMIPAEYRNRCYMELINEPNKKEYWNHPGGTVSAFAQMVPWSKKFQDAGFPTISPSVTESYQGNVAGQYKGVPSAHIDAFTLFGFHCYQNDPAEFLQCLLRAKVVAQGRKVALTEWGEITWGTWVPPIESYAKTVPAMIDAVCENTFLSAYFIGTPHWSATKAPYLLNPTDGVRTVLYEIFKTGYGKYKGA